MIGRFANTGIYKELASSSEFYKTLFAGGLAVGSYVLDRNTDTPSAAGLVLASLALAINGLPIVWGALKGLWERKTNVDELVTIAIIASVIQGEILSAAFVSFVMVMGSLIEELTSDSARKSIKALVQLSPESATIIRNGENITVPVAEVKPGDVLLVKPGERVPADATVKSGITSVDESSLTGEPIPVEKSVGDKLYAGTLNHNGVVEITATRVGGDSTIGKVIHLVSEAEKHRPESVRLMDRYARFFTPAILFCAGLTFVLSGNINSAVTVLIVGCPCALILAAPTAIVAAISRAAQAGVLVKGGMFLEEIGRANVFLFDKTGTITEGRPKVDAIFTTSSIEEKELLGKAASVEENSTHPLARAVLQAAHYAKVTILRAEDMLTEIGLGISARVNGSLIEVGSSYVGGGSANLPATLRTHLDEIRQRGATPLVVYQDRKPLGIIGVADHLRPGAGATVSELKKLGINRLGLLSGDHEKAVKMVASSVGLTDSWSGMKPQGKLDVIESFRKDGRRVVFIGDGINDAPALSAADVGIAMAGAGTDVALETADVALMHDDISRLPFLVKLSRRTSRIIKWNIFFGLLFNAAAVIAGGFGLITPVMGAVVHNAGSVLVVLSSASLVFYGEKS